MPSQLWPIIGVVVGALLALTGQLLNGLLQRRWARQDSVLEWHRQREARLFDFKRTALTDFLAHLERAHASLTDFELHPHGSPPQVIDYYYLWDHQSVVAIYGSIEATQTSQDAVLAFAQLVDSDGAEVLQAAERFQTAKRAYVAAVRADLGSDAPAPVFHTAPEPGRG